MRGKSRTLVARGRRTGLSGSIRGRISAQRIDGPVDRPSALCVWGSRSREAAERPIIRCMLDVVHFAEAGVRALAFWLYLFSPKYRGEIHRQWLESGPGGRTMLLFECLISVVLGIGGPVLFWQLLI